MNCHRVPKILYSTVKEQVGFYAVSGMDFDGEKRKNVS